MAKIKLAVAGKSVYAARLTECMRKKAPDYLEVVGCQDVANLEAFMLEVPPDLLLYEQGIVAQEQIPKEIVHIQITTEQHTEQDAGQKRIFRYQKGSEILRQIFRIYEQSSKKKLVCRCSTADLEMIAFYAPGGHELLLPFSLSYASLCGKEQKALYVNLSEFSGMAPLFGEKSGNNLSDLVYGVRQKKEQFLLCLQSVLHQTEYFDYVLPPENPQDLYEIREEDLACVLTQLQEQTEYQKIIWNCGSLNQSAQQVMECCSKVFCMVKENAFGKYRKLELDAFLKKEKRQRLREKVQYLCPQMGSSGFIQGGSVLEQLQSGEFARQVQELTQDP